MTPKFVGLKEAVERWLGNLFTFDGRATRSEYWWVVLVISIAASVISVILNAVGLNEKVVSTILGIAEEVLIIGLSVRRLHDVGKGWGWIFIEIVPIIGWIWYFVLMVTASVGDNQYGPMATVENK